jgi:Fe-S-cluster containining protein
MACGACCALHVSFHRSELDRHGGTVPARLVVPYGAPEHVAMRQSDERCVALEGAIGRGTRCAVYADRPSPCRAFEPSWLHGAPNPWCDEARARHGLPALAPADLDAPPAR